MTPEEIDAELEGERVCDSKATPRQETASAPVPKAGSGRKPRRSRSGSQDSQSLAEMVGASPSQNPAPLQTVSDLLDSGRLADQRGDGSNDSLASPDADGPLSFLCVLGGVKFNAEGETIITLESMYDLAEIVKLKDYRHQILRVEVHRA